MKTDSAPIVDRNCSLDIPYKNRRCLASFGFCIFFGIVWTRHDKEPEFSIQRGFKLEEKNSISLILFDNFIYPMRFVFGFFLASDYKCVRDPLGESKS